MRILILIIFFSLIGFCFEACTPKAVKTKVSVYHWKLVSNSSNESMTPFSFASVYLHIMDVRWEPGLHAAIPRAMLQIKKANSVFSYPLIPVIYIDNEVFAKIETDSIPVLASQILEMKRSFAEGFGLSSLSHLQIDCDWLKSHKEKYFAFLQELKTQEPGLRVSATIRLYPYRYPDIMGVPPVDFGVLMCYNMGKIQSPSSFNSILDNDLLVQYLQGSSYPIPVKPAIPLFGWYAWFRNEVFQSLLYLPNEFSDNPLLQTIKSNNFRVLRDTVIGEYYFRNGDVLRNEFPTVAELYKTIQLLQDKLPHTDEIILYHWDEEHTLHNYESLLYEIMGGAMPTTGK